MSGWAHSPICAQLAGDRWHFQHGPIDLIIDVDADALVGRRAIVACWHEFQVVLLDLVAELAELRRAAGDRPAARGPVAQRMLRACAPFADERFITPMAAVAGAVADHLIATLSGPGVRRAFINNGGDIALWLTPGASYRVGIWPTVERPLRSDGTISPQENAFEVVEQTPVRGVATSGWRGRSFSLGVADSVTVLAADAAAADAAATLIANAVNCDWPGILRRPAEQLKDDTDLGSRLVTVEVPPLPGAAIALALSSGRAEAERWRDRGLIYAAALFLQGRVELVPPSAHATLERRPSKTLLEPGFA
jgi:uncharacterized protein